MFIKLTRLDNSPIWFNAAFVVTVEPRKLGGATVVPIGDGLDYDVRETAEQVLEMLGAAPAPAVVPVPVPKSLTPTPADVSPEAEQKPAEDEPKPAKRARSRAKATAADGEAAPKRTVRKTRAKSAKKALIDFPEEQVERLKRMAPGSMRKLLNTLTAHFKVADAEAVVAALVERGTVAVEQEHVIWK